MHCSLTLKRKIKLKFKLNLKLKQEQYYFSTKNDHFYENGQWIINKKKGKSNQSSSKLEI